MGAASVKPVESNAAAEPPRVGCPRVRQLRFQKEVGNSPSLLSYSGDATKVEKILDHRDTTELFGPASRFPGLPPGDVKGQKFQTREKSLPRAQHWSLAADGAPVTVLGFTNSRTPHPDVTPTWAVHKAALRPQAAEVYCRQDPTLPRTAHSYNALRAAAICTPRRGGGCVVA
ncbi:hypothetical protein U0070_010944 [Myodes glareolus]|uniref:Uncharacterized protein n=1 Tax=Myodes glareolus TaxID=447135 RepID=A0AAW0HUW1_MYOGA